MHSMESSEWESESESESESASESDDMTTTDEESVGSDELSDLIYTSDEEAEKPSRTDRGEKDVLKKVIKTFLTKIPSVFKYFPAALVKKNMALLRKLANHVGAHVPDNAEDVAFSQNVDEVTMHHWCMANDLQYVKDLIELRAAMKVKGDLMAVIEDARRERGGSDDLEACVKHAQCLLGPLDAARDAWPTWLNNKELKDRFNVLQAENGINGKAGTNIKWAALLYQGKTLLKISDIPADAAQLLSSIDHSPHPDLHNVLEDILRELRAATSIDDLLLRNVDVASDKSVTIAPMSFALGMQGKPNAARYEEKQSLALKLMSLNHRSFFGTAQSEFASNLALAEQSRGTEWTSFTLISKGNRHGQNCEQGKASKIQQKSQRRFEELQRRLHSFGQQSLGFSPGEDGVRQIKLFIAQNERFLVPHGDVLDWIRRHRECGEFEFWDRLACLVTRSGLHAEAELPLPSLMDLLKDAHSSDVSLTRHMISAQVAERRRMRIARRPAALATAGSLGILGSSLSGKSEEGHSPLEFMAALSLEDKPTEPVAQLLRSLRGACNGDAVVIDEPAAQPAPMNIDTSGAEAVPLPPSSSPPVSLPSSPAPLSHQDSDEESHAECDTDAAQIALIPAEEDGTINHTCALTQAHSADGKASWRDAFIAYKTKESARFLHALYRTFPTLCSARVPFDMAIAIVKRYVVGHTSKEIPKLRRAGRWKASSSKHDGERVYSVADARSDAELYEQDPELRAELQLMRSEAAAAAADATSEADRAPEATAAVMAKMLTSVGPQTIGRVFAHFLIDATADTASPYQREDFQCISDFVWDNRIGHTVTHFDSKTSKYIIFANEMPKASPAEELSTFMSFSHTAYMTASQYHKLFFGESTWNVAWLRGETDVCRQSVADILEARLLAEAPSTATQRHGISGLPYKTKPPNENTGKGGCGTSLVGYSSDINHRSDLSLLKSLKDKKQSLYNAAKEDGAAGLLKSLKKNCRGAGGLISKGAMRYGEACRKFDKVLDCYQPGDAGTFFAALFASQVADVAPATKATMPNILTALKRRLERKNVNGRRMLAQAVYDFFKGCPALAPLAEAASQLLQTCLTGGTMETFGCDGIWRLYRPLHVGCEKPRPKKWDKSRSGGNPLTYFPFWHDDGTLHIYKLREFLLHYVDYYVGRRQELPVLGDQYIDKAL